MRVSPDDAQPRRGSSLLSWVPRAISQTHVTGKVIDSITGGKEASQEIIRFYESLSFIVTLLLSVIYPSFQFATTVADSVNAHVPGLGTAFFTLSLLAVVADLLSAVGSILVIFCADLRFEFRMPYLLWTVGAYATIITVLLEAVVRRGRLDQPASEGAEDVDGEELAAQVVPAAVLTVLCCLCLLVFLLSSTAKMMRSNLIFSTDATASAYAERRALRDGKPPWFAHPSTAELRGFLDAYWRDFGTGAFSNPNPAHWQLYCSRVVQEQGHGALGYLATRAAEAMFEERVQAMLLRDRESSQ
jgi:hypothetical protein